VPTLFYLHGKTTFCGQNPRSVTAPVVLRSLASLTLLSPFCFSFLILTCMLQYSLFNSVPVDFLSGVVHVHGCSGFVLGLSVSCLNPCQWSSVLGFLVAYLLSSLLPVEGLSFLLLVWSFWFPSLLMFFLRLGLPFCICFRIHLCFLLF